MEGHKLTDITWEVFSLKMYQKNEWLISVTSFNISKNINSIRNLNKTSEAYKQNIKKEPYNWKSSKKSPRIWRFFAYDFAKFGTTYGLIQTNINTTLTIYLSSPTEDKKFRYRHNCYRISIKNRFPNPMSNISTLLK